MSMTNSKLLQEKIKASGISITFISDKIGISREAFYKKLNNETEFKASEIMALQKTLRLTDAQRDSIFFCFIT